MPTPNNPGGPLAGLDAQLAGLPISQAVRGGTQTAFNGVAPPNRTALRDGSQTSPASFLQTQGTPGEAPPLAGMGELLEADDAEVFETLHALNLRQERLSKNRLAQDKHWTRIKMGYQWSALEKVQDQDIYRAVLPPGSDPLRPAAVPNKAADLCNKLVETLMVDPPQPSPQATTDQEEDERGAEMAREFLTQDGGEEGTDDAAAFWYSIDAATCRASAFHHYWVEPHGGGSQPMQIKAHPQAQDPAHPLSATDQTGQPIPTTDYILRYVTDPDPETGKQQFTPDASKAERQWLPKIRIDRWGREHVRLFPEDQDVQGASEMLGLYYSTVSDGKKRWKNVAQLDPSEIQGLCDWTPPRYLILLPPALRARWKLQVGGEKDTKGGSSEQRMFFYYAYAKKADPDYPRGAVIYASGAFGGFTIDRDTLAAEVPLPPQQGQSPGTDIRDMDLPLVQIRLIQDPDDRDPTGRAFMERIGGANEAMATLGTSFLEAFDINLHPATYTPGTSPVEGWQVDQSRASGDHIPILGPEDKPVYEQPRLIPEGLPPFMEWVEAQMDSMASLNKPVQGADNQQEVSGTARSIAVRQAMVSLSRMQQAVLGSYERHWRIKLQLAMKYFRAPQLLRYVGEDGAYKQEWWRGVDFAHVTDVGVQAGTGTMMAPQDKVNYVGTLRQLQFMSPDEAIDAARPTFAQTVGLPDDPHQQRIERQVSSWLQGPPDQQWVQRYQQYQQQLAQYQQQVQAYQAQQAQVQQQQAEAQQAGAVQQQATQLARQKQAEQQASAQVDQAKQTAAHQSAMQVEAERHRMTMERDQAQRAHEAQTRADDQQREQQREQARLAQTPSAAPAASAEPAMRKSDFGKLHEALAKLASQPPPHVEVHVPPHEAPVVHVAAPVVHVPAHPAPVVKVEPPDLSSLHHHLEALHASVTKKRGKRTHRFTDPTGKKWTVETDEEPT